MDNDKVKALAEACKFIWDTIGACPLDLFDIEPFDEGCESKCVKNMEQKCWEKYFLRKVL